MTRLLLDPETLIGHFCLTSFFRNKKISKMYFYMVLILDVLIMREETRFVNI